MFQLHPRLEADSLPVDTLSLCELRLINDNRFLWVILVPQRSKVTEVHQLTTEDQQQLIIESSRLAVLLTDLTGADKINLGALGNMVPQLHWHVVARRTDDPCWPGPVWGCNQAEPYPDKIAADWIRRLSDGVQK